MPCVARLRRAAWQSRATQDEDAEGTDAAEKALAYVRDSGFRFRQREPVRLSAGTALPRKTGNTGNSGNKDLKLVKYTDK